MCMCTFVIAVLVDRFRPDDWSMCFWDRGYMYPELLMCRFIELLICDH